MYKLSSNCTCWPPNLALDFNSFQVSKDPEPPTNLPKSKLGSFSEEIYSEESFCIENHNAPFSPTQEAIEFDQYGHSLDSYTLERHLSWRIFFCRGPPRSASNPLIVQCRAVCKLLRDHTKTNFSASEIRLFHISAFTRIFLRQHDHFDYNKRQLIF